MTDSPATHPETPAPRKASGGAQFLINMGPLIAFFLAYYFSDSIAPVFGWEAHPSKAILSATAVLLPCLAAGAFASWLIEKRLPPMHVVGLILGLGLGSLTLWLEDGDFIKMKVTAVYLLFATLLGGGLMLGRPLVRDVLSEAIKLDDAGWRKLSLRWALFFLVAACVNEVIWRTQSEELWVNYKVWGMLIATMLFGVAQAPLIAKHQIEEQS